MWLASTLLACAAALPLALGWSGPLYLGAPSAGFRRPLQQQQAPAFYGLGLASSHKRALGPYKDHQQQQQLIPLRQESVVIPGDVAQAAAEDAEEAQSATDAEGDLQLVFYSFINAPDRSCPDGQYRDAQGVCRDAW